MSYARRKIGFRSERYTPSLGTILLRFNVLQIDDSKQEGDILAEVRIKNNIKIVNVRKWV
jgi:hypothetical protein